MNYLPDFDWRREGCENPSHPYSPTADLPLTSSIAIEKIFQVNIRRYLTDSVKLSNATKFTARGKLSIFICLRQLKKELSLNSKSLMKRQQIVLTQQLGLNTGKSL